MDAKQEIKELEDNLKNTQYNKATEHYFGVIKAKIARLREKQEKRSSASGGGEGWFQKKAGDATAIILGFPSVGKSTLLNALTGTKSKTAAYAFTTLTVIPGTLTYKGAKIQILDVPGIIEGAAEGKGRGKEVLGMVRNSDLIVILVEAQHPEHRRAILKEIYDVGVRVDQRAPDVKISKRMKGGLDIASTVPLEVDFDTLKSICKEFRLINADIVIRDKINIDQFIDVIEGNRVYIPSVTVIAKSDLLTLEKAQQIKEELKPDLFVSAQTGMNINKMKDIIYDSLKFMRIYLKEINKKPDMEEPMIVRSDSTIEDICRKIHKDFVRKFKYVRIWGKTAKFPGQTLRHKDKRLADCDILEIHIK